MVGIELIKIPDICLCDSSSAIEYKYVLYYVCMHMRSSPFGRIRLD